MSDLAAPRGLLGAVTDAAGYVAGFLAIYAGFTMLEKIARNTDALIARVDDLDVYLHRPVRAPEPAAQPAAGARTRKASAAKTVSA